jgi:hypothetical protein
MAMPQSDWKRIVDQIEKAIQKTNASNKENAERAIKEQSALIGAPLNGLKEHFDQYVNEQAVAEVKKARREIATIVGVFATALFSLAAAVIFYFQLQATDIAIADARSASAIQHNDTLTSLQRADEANRNAKSTSDQQALDTAKALALSKESADAAARAVETTIASERARLYVVPMPVSRTDEKSAVTSIPYQILNLGRTTALVVSITAKCSLIDNDGIAIKNVIYSSNDIHAAMNVISAGSVYKVPVDCIFDTPVSEDDFLALAAKTKLILFSGHVQFQDVFGGIWTKHFGVYSFADKELSFFGVVGIDGYNAEEKNNSR